MNQKVNKYIAKHENWSAPLKLLRSTLSDSILTEDLKWGSPTYTLDKKNIISLVAFKSYIGLWFHQGVFIQDKYPILEQSSDKTKGMRKLMFSSSDEVQKEISTIRNMIQDAIQAHKDGKEIKVEKKKSFSIPDELQNALSIEPKLNLAFSKLSRGNQRLYAEYISSAKQDKTKQSRLAKIMPMIKNGKGLHDKYKK